MADIQAIANQLSELTVIQMAELSKLLEEKWGVSAAAAAPVMMAGGGAAAGAAAAAPAEEKTEFALHLTSAGERPQGREGGAVQGRSGGHEEEVRGGRGSRRDQVAPRSAGRGWS
jgi:hypothetical protein